MAKRKTTKVTKEKAPRKSANRTPPFAGYPDWSEAKFWGFIRSGLRATYNKWPPKWEVLSAAKRPYSGKGKRQKWEFQCNDCKQWHAQANVSIDHIEPAGSLRCFADLPTFVERLFVGADRLQCLCSECHNKKTQEERSNK